MAGPYPLYLASSSKTDKNVVIDGVFFSTGNETENPWFKAQYTMH